MRAIDHKIKRMVEYACQPEKEIIYGVKLQKNNSDPNLSVTYIDDSELFVPSSGNNGDYKDNGWDSRFPFNKIKPCLLKNGAVQYYLNPNNFNKKSDGTVSCITDETYGDVMIEFPKIWYSITQDADYIYIRYSNVRREGFTDWGMSYKGTVKEKFYVGAYLGCVINDKLCSLSGKVPSTLLSISELRTKAQANGTGYEQLSWNKLILLQILFIVRFKSLNSQTALGKGYTDDTDITSTGSANILGMNYGSDTSSQIKFCGIEDFWGNLFQYVDGIVLNADGTGGVTRGNVAVSDGNYNDTANNYSVIKTGLTSSLSGYVSNIHATDCLGFLVSAVGGTSNTNFCDYGYYSSTTTLRFAYYGGCYNSSEQAGIFYSRIYAKATDILDNAAGRLIYCG